LAQIDIGECGQVPLSHQASEQQARIATDEIHREISF
jgi:hypothetical protein